MDWKQRITFDPKILYGKSIVKGDATLRGVHHRTTLYQWFRKVGLDPRRLRDELREE